MPFVIAPALAVIVTVPAAGVLAAIVPTFQRTIVPAAAGITVGAGSDGDEVLETYVKPGRQRVLEHGVEERRAAGVPVAQRPA